MELGFKAIGKGLNKAGQAVKKGVGATAKGAKNVAGAGVKGIKSLLKFGAKLASKSGSMIIRNGKIVIKSLQKGFMKGAKKLRGLVDRILQKFKFKRFKLERKGKHIRLYGEVNPWVLLIDGTMKDVDEKQLEKELKQLELDGKKPIKLSDAEYSKLNKIDIEKRAKISKNADGDKSKIDFNSVEGTVKDGSVSKDKTLVGKGEQYTNGRKNKLNPNIRYKTGEYDYFYETDSLGRLSKFETENLQLTKRKERLPHSKNTPGKIKGKDDAGHLAGDRFGGSPKIDNLVSQLSDVNQKQFKKIENLWADALKATPPKKVTVDVEMIYSEEGIRPDKFIVKYTIDGKPGINVFENN